MKIKLLFVFAFLITNYCFSQNQKTVSGTISSENFRLKDVEIINQNSQQITKTDEYGAFKIDAKLNEKITFFLIGYKTKQLTIDAKILDQKLLEIELVKKPIEIEEIVVEQKEKAWSQDYLDQILNKLYVDDGQTSPKNTMVYDGQTLGVNMIAVGRLVNKLFKKNEKAKTQETLSFYDHVTSNFNKKFFLETLKLQEDEIALFLEFCESDPKSQTILGNNTLLSMDFLIEKNAEFKKMNSIFNSQKP